MKSDRLNRFVLSSPTGIVIRKRAANREGHTHVVDVRGMSVKLAAEAVIDAMGRIETPPTHENLVVVNAGKVLMRRYGANAAKSRGSVTGHIDGTTRVSKLKHAITELMPRGTNAREKARALRIYRGLPFGRGDIASKSAR